MDATSPTNERDSEDTPRGTESVDGPLARPTPNEDGPHDVPDDAVIEKTLPTGTGSGERRGER